MIARLDGEIGNLQSSIQLDLLYGDFRQLRATLKFGNEMRELYAINRPPLLELCLTGHRVSGIRERDVSLFHGQGGGGIERDLSFLRGVALGRDDDDVWPRRRDNPVRVAVGKPKVEDDADHIVMSELQITCIEVG